MQHRKIVARVLAVVAITVAGFLPAQAKPAVSDLQGHWAKIHIETMLERGIMGGYPDGLFRPDNPITREEFAAVLARAKGLKETRGGLPCFGDVAPEDWSYTYVQALSQAGVLHPEDYGTRFGPQTPITRQEIAVMLVRAAGFEKEVVKKGSLTVFSDSMPDWSKGYVTVALNHGLIAGYDDGAFRPGTCATRAEAGLMVLRLLDPKARPATWVETYRYQGNSGSNTLRVVRVNFNRDDIHIRPALAGNIRENAYLGDIAKREGAVAAVNGTYFSAYSNVKGDFREPYNALAIDGQWVHFQYQGTALGITGDKRIIMDPIRMSIQGSANGSEGAWSAWSVNHTAPDIIGVFTRHRGETTGMADGITFSVKNGRIVSKGGPDVPIPNDGYIIFLSSSRINQWTAGTFTVGAKVEYKVCFSDHGDRPYPNAREWERVKHAIGCGPRLVKDGCVAVNPQAEGYTEDKQTVLPYNRSGVGVTCDNIVTLVTCALLTPQEFGEAMADLGCVNAMQMDSGASSCLWYRGAYLTEPGRMINNGLFVFHAGQ